MDIAIIGSGNVGSALARAFTRSGHDVTITARDPEHAEDTAQATGATVAGSNTAAVEKAEIVVLATPFASAPEIAAEIRDQVAGKIVVDVSNRMSFGANGPDMDTSTSNAEELAALLPDARIVKAFNTLFASNQADPVLDDVQLDGFVAGDDVAAKAKVLKLVASIGLEPVDVGPLARARQLESLAFLNISLNATHDGAWRSGWKLVAAPSTTDVTS
jgi:8-hydroxy-5-deazaflavin:NADPH oxidoreductase